MGNSASKKRRKQEKKLQQKEQQQQQLQQEQQQHAVTVELPPGSPVRSPPNDVVGSSSGGIGVGGSVRDVPSLRGDKSLHSPPTPLSSGTVRGAPPESPVTKPPPGGTMRRSEPYECPLLPPAIGQGVRNANHRQCQERVLRDGAHSSTPGTADAPADAPTEDSIADEFSALLVGQFRYPALPCGWLRCGLTHLRAPRACSVRSLPARTRSA